MKKLKKEELNSVLLPKINIEQYDHNYRKAQCKEINFVMKPVWCNKYLVNKTIRIKTCFKNFQRQSCHSKYETCG